MKHVLSVFVVLVLAVGCLSACTPVRTEFYRNETKFLYETGCQSYKQGDYDNARIVFEETISLDPDYGPAHAALGNLAMIREEYERAHDFYEQAMAHDPELEKELMPFLMITEMHESRAPLTEAGVELATVYPLVMEVREAERNDLFTKDLPLELLAKDTVSLTPGQIGELRQKAADTILRTNGPNSYRLFVAYLLFEDEQYDSVTRELLAALIRSSQGRLLQKAQVLSGRLGERQGNPAAAAESYLAAMAAGLPLGEVAHHLARIYQVDIATVLPSEINNNDQQESPQKTKPFTGPATAAEPVEFSELTLEETAVHIPEPHVSLISTSD